MIPLSDLFEVRYGHSLELNRLTLLDEKKGGIPFVSRKMGDNGISAYVAPIPNVEPASAGLLTCALSGNGVLSTFLQEQPFYTGFHIACLKPLQELNKEQLLYYCACIKSNRYRFSYGRQANRTLKNILIPSLSELPDYVSDANVDMYVGCDEALNNRSLEINTKLWASFRYDEIFEIKKGYYNKKPPMSLNNADIPFIGATEKRNGVTGFVMYDNLAKYSRDGSIIIDEAIERKLFPAECITVSNNGSVGEAFYQAKPFTCSHDVNPLYLKDKNIRLTPAIGLFLASIIRAEKYRWGYGRKWRPIRMPESIIKLPVKLDSSPDWQFMEQYIETLPYSSQM